MTIQTKRYIELSDILAVRFTCNHCAAALSLAISDQKLTEGKDAQQSNFLETCPSCGRYWANNGADYEPTVKAFTSALERLRKALHDQPVKFRPGFSLAVEITPTVGLSKDDVL